MRFTGHSLRSILPAFVVAALAALATSPAAAQVPLNVPFNFQAAGSVWPAGRYMVDTISFGTQVTLRGAGHSFIWVLGAGSPAPDDRRVILSFDRVGANYALRSVQYKSRITPRLDKDQMKEAIPAPPVVVVGQ